MTTTPRGAKKESHIRSPSIPPCHKTRQGRIIAGRLKDLGSHSSNPRTSPPPAPSPNRAISLARGLRGGEGILEGTGDGRAVPRPFEEPSLPLPRDPKRRARGSRGRAGWGYDGVRPAPRVRMRAWAPKAGRRWMVEVVIDRDRKSLMSQHR